MIYAYIRVSTDKQTVENQRFEIKQFCSSNGIHIDRWIEETISGKIDVSKRRLGRLLKNLKKDDIIVCSELSRLGRSLFMIMDVLSECMKREVQLWTIKDNYRLGTDISSKVLAFAFGLSAEIERNLISQRTREALARAKSEGKKLGRRRGEKGRLNPRCCRKHNWIIKAIERGLSKSEIAKKIRVSRSTLYRYLIYTGAFTPQNCRQDNYVKFGIFH